MPKPTTRPRGSKAGGSLFLTGSAILVVTAVVIAVAAVRRFSGHSGPVLPVSWCRSASMLPLPPLSGLRWFTSWQLDRVAVIAVLGVAVMYAAGVVSVARLRRRWPVRHTVAFAAGLGVVLLATCSSVGVYDMAMFSAHMLGHLMLVMVAPPLLVLGRPMTLALHATRNPWHARIRRVVRSRALALVLSPPVALAGYATVIVGTHLTGLMNVIMTHAWAGQLEHLAYLLVGYQFFVLLVGDEPLRWRMSMPAKQLLLGIAMAVDTFTGVVLLQSNDAIQMMGLSPDHVDPLGQTRLGGAIMWVGGDAVMAITMIALVVSWMRRPERRRVDARGWLERTRRETFAAHVSLAGDVDRVRDIDEDDQAREAYNDWLNGLAGTSSPRPGRN